MSANEPSTESVFPTHLEKIPEECCLVIQWSDELVQKISFRKLRDSCRCATCVEKGSEPNSKTQAGGKKLENVLPVLSLAETMPLDIVLMHPVGNYAYSIHFSDGHNTGIFSFELLRSLQ